MTPHEPKPWDLYQTPRGTRYIIEHDHETLVLHVMTEYGVQDYYARDTVREHTYLGNVLALPQLAGLVNDVVAENMLLPCNPQDPALDAMEECPPDHPNRCWRCDWMHRARTALRDAGL